MEANTYICSHCGSSIPADQVDVKRRRGYCRFCGLESIFPKKRSTASPNAVIALEEASKLFNVGNFESAKECAETAISMSRDNAGALYIINYHKSYASKLKSSKGLETFFTETLPNSELELEEEEMFKQSLLKTIHHSCDYEKYILKKFVEFDDDDELLEFVESFCPFSILAHKSIEWFDAELIEIYKEISRRIVIPKTWFALYKAMQKNPDSPFAEDTFYLKTKARRVYDSFILPIGDIYNSIKDETNKAKFLSGYKKLHDVYVAKMNQ
jgi:DNA-directed RNA polymerase subunit RPC12/RpoP